MTSIKRSFDYHAQTVDELHKDVSSTKSVLPVIEGKVLKRDCMNLNKCVEIQSISRDNEENHIDVVVAVAEKRDTDLSPNNNDRVYRNTNKKSFVV